MLQQLFNVIAFLAAVEASPFPQGVTMAIAPSGGIPDGCATSYAGTFGIAITRAGGSSSGGAVATQSADGQPAAGTSTAQAVTQISDAQPQAPTGAVSQIVDGQPQAPEGAVSQLPDGQPQAATMTMHAMSQIGDGQIQAPMETVPAVSQIGDGQPQAPSGAVSQLADGQPQAPTGAAVSTIADGQAQAPAGGAVSTIADGQAQAPTGAAVSTIADGQAQAPTGAAVSTIADGQPQATGSASSGGSGSSSGGAPAMVACKNDDTLQMTLSDGVLLDNQGRTGYIASNYQFQFDKPAQAGAIYTAGFSVCGNGTLALGGSTTFYQCLSGDFYNLYNENWAPQCEPVDVMIVQLVDC